MFKHYFNYITNTKLKKTYINLYLPRKLCYFDPCLLRQMCSIHQLLRMLGFSTSWKKPWFQIDIALVYNLAACFWIERGVSIIGIDFDPSKFNCSVMYRCFSNAVSNLNQNSTNISQCWWNDWKKWLSLSEHDVLLKTHIIRLSLFKKKEREQNTVTKYYLKHAHN